MAILERVREQNLAVHLNGNLASMRIPGADRIDSQEIESYDLSYYETQHVRAVGSVLPPLGSTRHSEGELRLHSLPPSSMCKTIGGGERG